MTRAFFEQVEDEFRGLVGPGLRDYESVKASRLFKLWYGDPAVHFEAQRISGRWGPRRKGGGGGILEVGLHLEFPSRGRNDSILEELSALTTVEKKLPGSEAAKAFGPQSATWRRISEVMEVEEEDDPDLAAEVAERLAAYVRCLKPLLDKSAVT